MTNFQVYRKTLPFSLLRFLVDIASLIILIGSAVAGFFIANQSTSKALIGMIVGLVIGIILNIVIQIFVDNRIKAAQISMMVKGVTEESLPDHTVKAGFDEIKGRFGKITSFLVVTWGIKAIFRQISRGINRVATAIGGDTGNTITSVIDSAIQTLIEYLCECCMGWVLFRKEQGTAKSACEGAVIFFKNGKSLFRNIGRIFGMGLLSLIVVGGLFFGLGYGISLLIPSAWQGLANEISEAAIRGGEEAPAFLLNVTNLMLIASGLFALILWAMVHKVLIRPFILVGVMRNFMQAGIANMPTEKDFAELDSKSPRFAKMHNEI